VAKGVAIPAPAATKVVKKAITNTGPMKPKDCAAASSEVTISDLNLFVDIISPLKLSDNFPVEFKNL
jgi:hypothetical protein